MQMLQLFLYFSLLLVSFLDAEFLQHSNIKNSFQDSLFELSSVGQKHDIISNLPDKSKHLEKCPPCFNCMLPMFECKQFSSCNEFTGQCECLDGYGGADCSEPLCGALSNGNRNRPLRKENSTQCQCEDGWGGINCNICLKDSVCDSFMPQPDLKGTCYKQGLIVNKFHQMCDVTNPKIVEILAGKKPQVTFSCNKTDASCNFQFWIAQKESFYCGLDSCKLNYDLSTNTSHYQCENVKCKCIPGRMLCGENGSIDISEFLTETIQGPGDYSCDVSKKDCKFSEPSMNDLIMSVFGDPYITLHCNSGECVHYSEIPGYFSPPKKNLSMYNILLITVIILGISSFLVVSVIYIKKSPLFGDSAGDLQLPDSTDNFYHSQNGNIHHIPVTLTFKNIKYSLDEKLILTNAFGIAKPAEMLAIMGGSGAGKTTLLDILGNKAKNGRIEGEILVNGHKLAPHNYRKIIGFVDQEDHLIPTLTVYETVLNSSLLKLPRTMLLSAKKLRVYEVLEELRILKIKDRLIGSDFQRGISGGEKRRVAIACELVTSPSVLFLDEPTSGLDSYNAKNVVECLVRLSKKYERTVIFTIHQPRSNIVAMFDKLLLLSEGNVVYSGDMLKCQEFFQDHGFRCPNGYNIADYLIDITSGSIANSSTSVALSENTNVVGGEHNINKLLARRESEIDPSAEWAHLASHRDEFSQILIPTGSADANLQLGSSRGWKNNIVNIFVESVAAEQIMLNIDDLNMSLKDNDDVKKIEMMESNEASIFQQIVILSSRTFKNIYRNPKLLLAQYVLSVFMGCFISILYYDVSNDISGFQNRMGLFFFVLSFFGFSTLTNLHSFSIERIVFMRERSNNYYCTFSYYISKIFCDVLPLRVFPPAILLAIIYPLVGLNMDNNGFLKACLILILFNLATSLEILVVGILIKESGNATLIGVLILLFSMLFSGLFINMKPDGSANSFANKFIDLTRLKYLSTFHYGYESLIINEVKTLVLRETKYGLKIEVPGATILSTFGFNVGGLWDNVIYLAMFCGLFLLLGFLCLHYFVIERK